MKKTLPLIFTLFCVVSLAFSQEKAQKSFVYTSADTKGYISITKTDAENETGESNTIETTVNAEFGNDILNFTVKTFNESDEMTDPYKLVFEGTMHASFAPVVFEGNRIKTAKNGSYWNFKGDYKEEAISDPDLKPFFKENYMSTLKLPERTIPTFNLWAIIPNLEFNKEAAFAFNTLDETRLYVKKNQTVSYLGKYEASINGEAVTLHKFVHQGKGIKPAYFLVNDNRELVQVILDGKFTFTLDKTAKVATKVAYSGR